MTILICLNYSEQEQGFCSKQLDAFILRLQVKAFRSMLHNDMMVGAFSHSTAVGKLRKDLPDVPVDARFLDTIYMKQRLFAIIICGMLING